MFSPTTAPLPRLLKGLFCAGLLLACAGCYSELRVKPYAESSKARYVMVCGELKYSGNPRYVPATVGPCESGPGGYSIVYTREQDYTGTTPEQEAMLSLMPGTMFGVPTGKDKMFAYAMIKISRNGHEVAKYMAGCVKESYHNIYSGGVDNSEARQQCLDAIKLNLEAQMLRDEDFWKSNAAR